MADLDELASAYEPREVQPAHVSFSELRQNLKKHLDAVSASRAPLLVTRGKAEPVVLLALSEYEGMQETLHLMRSPANAERLLRSLAQAEAGDFVAFGSDE